MAKILSLKKCPPIESLQKKTKKPRNTFDKKKIGFLSNIVPTVKEKAAEVSPLIQEQFFSHWSDLRKAGVKIFSPPNSSIWTGLALPQVSLKYKLAIIPQPKIGPTTNPTNANLVLWFINFLIFCLLLIKFMNSIIKDRTGIKIIRFFK